MDVLLHYVLCVNGGAYWAQAQGPPPFLHLKNVIYINLN